MKKRLPLKWLRIGALILSLAGILLLVYAASGTATPEIKIGRIGATMNYAYARLSGQVIRGPYYDPARQTLRFYVKDDTGEIQVFAFREVARELIASRLVPAVGDDLAIEGTLRVRDDFTSFYLAAADKLKLVRAVAQEAEIGQLSSADEFAAVRIRGTVREIWSPYEGLTLITVQDSSGELPVAVTADVEAIYGKLPTVSPGATIQVDGVVVLYRDEPQLALRHPSHLTVVHPLVGAVLVDTATPPRPKPTAEASSTANPVILRGSISTLSMSNVGSRGEVEGQLTRADSFSRGMRYTLDDGTGTIVLLIWSEVFDEFGDREQLVPGARVRALGKIEVFNGELEIIPETGLDIAIVAPSRTPTPSFAAIHSISSADLDRVVLISGAIVALEEFSRGLNATVQDETGEIRVTLFSNVLTPIQSQLKVGKRIQVRGRVNLFRGVLEIVAEEGGVQLR